MSAPATTDDQAVSLQAVTAPSSLLSALDAKPADQITENLEEPFKWPKRSCHKDTNFDLRCKNITDWNSFYTRTTQDMYQQNGGEKKFRAKRLEAISKAMQTASDYGDKPPAGTCLGTLRPFMKELMRKRTTEDSKLISDFVTKQRLCFKPTEDTSPLTDKSKLEATLNSVYDSLVTYMMSGRVKYEEKNNKQELYHGQYEAERQSFFVNILGGLYTGKAKMTAEEDTLRFEFMALSERYPGDRDAFANHAGFTWKGGIIEPVEPTHETALRNQDSSA